MFDIEGSGTVEIFNLAKNLEAKGKKLIHLEVGELDFDTPKYIIDSTINALKKNITKYTETKGLISLRNEIIKYINSRYNTRNISSEKNVLVTPGAKFGLFASILSFASPGDEIIVFAPSYPSYRAIPNAMNIKVREIPILNKSEPIPMEEIINTLNDNLNEKTRFFILNGPCNPTGQVIYPNTLKKVWESCKKFERIIFLADDVYEQFIYPPATFETPANFDRELKRTIIINGFSKTFCMTGFRLGYVVTNEEYINKLVRFQQNSVTCANSFAQKSGEIALKSYNESWIEYKKFKDTITNSLDERRKYIYKELLNIEGIKCGKPEGAFYVFPDISEFGLNSYDFCFGLIERGVVTTPGISFGLSGENHIRICYCNSLENIKKAITIIKQFCEEIKQKKDSNN